MPIIAHDPFRELSDDDIRQMAREAEAENLLLAPADRQPRGWYFRRAAILMHTMPLADISEDELAWRFAFAMGQVRGI